MEIRENLELVNVEYEGTTKVVLSFIDAEKAAIRKVNFNKQAFKDGKFVDDAEKAEKVDKWCKDYFDTDFDNLKKCIGVKMTVYVYPNFCSLWESDSVVKFTKEDLGTMINTTVKEIVVDDVAIRIRYEYEGNTYESKMSYAEYIDYGDKKMWLKDEQKQKKQYEKFEAKFGVPVAEKDSLVGHDLIVEVKSAFGSNFYGDIKAFPKKKK